MKKVLLIVLCIAMVLCISGCSKDESDLDYPTTISEEDILGEESAQEFETIERYLLYYEKVEGMPVLLTGVLYNDELCDIEGYASVKLSNADSVKNFSKIKNGSKVYIYGKSCIDDENNPYINIFSFTAYSRLTEPYWSNTTLVTDDNITELFSEYHDPNELYEFTGMMLNDGKYYIMLDDSYCVVAPYMATVFLDSNAYNRVGQILINDVNPDPATGSINFNVVEFYPIE